MFCFSSVLAISDVKKGEQNGGLGPGRSVQKRANLRELLRRQGLSAKGEPLKGRMKIVWMAGEEDGQGCLLSSEKMVFTFGPGHSPH